MRKFEVRAAALWAVLFLACQPATAKDVSWDRTENMKQAGQALAEMWAKKGALGIFEHIEKCHEEHVLQATEYSREAETCLVQDVVHSRMSASIYARESEAMRKISGSPKAETVLRAMVVRVVATGRKFGIAAAEMKSLVDQAMEVAGKAYLDAMKARMEAFRKRAAGQ